MHSRDQQTSSSPTYPQGSNVHVTSCFCLYCCCCNRSVHKNASLIPSFGCVVPWSVERHGESFRQAGAGACESGGLVVDGCARCGNCCANLYRSVENRALHERVQMSKLHALERAAKQVNAKREALAKATAALDGAEDHYRDLVDRRKAQAAREEEQDFYEENDFDIVGAGRPGQFLARIEVESHQSFRNHHRSSKC